MKKVLIIDNYDSFTFNLVHHVEEILKEKVTVKKNDEIALSLIEEFEYLIISPGPGLPKEAGQIISIIQKYKAQKKILGVCLGLQAIVEAFGGQLKKSNTVFHGIQSNIEITNANSLLYHNVPERIAVGRYHSWIIDELHLPNELIITARDNWANIMSLEHKTFQIYGVQFHPESIMTSEGKTILANFLNLK